MCTDQPVCSLEKKHSPQVQPRCKPAPPPHPPRPELSLRVGCPPVSKRCLGHPPAPGPQGDGSTPSASDGGWGMERTRGLESYKKARWTGKTIGWVTHTEGFRGASVVKNLPVNSGDMGFILVWEDPTCCGATKPGSRNS